MASDDLNNFVSRRNIFFSSSSIYAGSPAGFWEYGEIGTRIRLKLADFWRKNLVEQEGFVELEGSQILPEIVFKASGHLDNFNDPIVQCKKCSALHRADVLIADKINDIVPESLDVEQLSAMISKHQVACPKCGSKDFEKVKKFNMMMGLDIGATGNQKAFLRPETCQSLFCDFQMAYKNFRGSLPMGLSQLGKSFRNEIAPRNSLLRAREFCQAETEIFFDPKKINDCEKFDEIKDVDINFLLSNEKSVKKISAEVAVKNKVVSGKLIAYYIVRLQQFFEKLGFDNSNLRFRQLNDDEKAFYAKETWDFEVNSSFGWIELAACNYRSDHDLSMHQKFSKSKLSLKDDSGVEFIPHNFELSIGFDRMFLLLLDASLKKELRGKEERLFLSLPLSLEPWQVAVFPLVKKDGLLEKSQDVCALLRNHGFSVFFDEKGSIGKRYARVDEVGVKFAITIDYDSLSENSITLRDRDSTNQKRVSIDELSVTLWKLFNNLESF